ncbi:MAG: tetratricopeptide repeat protein [Bacteroidales bacterium]|jgi:hypothetical protein|nr:tetratricopeptide repeat protein [Bacteroidales bacterium]
MKRWLITKILVFLICSAFGQTGETESWRDTGYQARKNRNYPVAIEYYQKILNKDSSDYDARLALAKLFILTEDYPESISLYQRIYKDDNSDVEAMNGLGLCFGAMGRDSLAVVYYEKALKYLPGEVSQYLFLGGAYGNAGRMADAIRVYEQSHAIDATYSETWAGIGKMYYWLEKPVSSARYYLKALDLDPQNEKIKKEYRKVRQESGWGLTLRTSPVLEKEENYTINAWITTLKLEKRISDHFRIEADFLLDHSNRDFTGDIGDTTRWYNSSWIQADYITKHHTLSISGGYSNTDNKVSNYGLSWKLNYTPGKFALKNTVQAGYDYYYYWNHVGAKSVTDNASVRYSFAELGGMFSYGLVDPVYCIDNSNPDTGKICENPYFSFSISLMFRVLKRPDIRLGLNHTYLDYTYKSPLYYSPTERQLTGPSISIYYAISAFYFYGSFSYKIGNEYSYGEKLNVNNWSSLLEIGYEQGLFSFSVGGGNFYNPYYQNITGFAAIKVFF